MADFETYNDFGDLQFKSSHINFYLKSKVKVIGLSSITLQDGDMLALGLTKDTPVELGLKFDTSASKRVYTIASTAVDVYIYSSTFDSISPTNIGLELYDSRGTRTYSSATPIAKIVESFSMDDAIKGVPLDGYPCYLNHQKISSLFGNKDDKRSFKAGTLQLGGSNRGLVISQLTTGFSVSSSNNGNPAWTNSLALFSLYVNLQSDGRSVEYGSIVTRDYGSLSAYRNAGSVGGVLCSGLIIEL